ncbi:MAG: MATE family efflux transporter [Clostridia bacterium]|nr:MATE family efflux transporter [Clostridia bacterium]
MARKHIDMTRGPLFHNIISYTIPIMLTGFLQLLFNAADLIVVGQFCGSISVAAVGATGAITNLIVNLFIGLSVGTGVAVAQALGAEDSKKVHRAIHTAIPTALVGGIILTIVGVLCSETFLRWMDTPENVLPLSALYMKIYFAGIIFMMLYNFCASILRASGDTKSPLVFLTIAGVINVTLNVIFVTVFHLNVAGVALATTISQALSAVLVVIALIKRNDACKLQFSKLHFYKDELMQIIKIGLPAGIQGSLFSISNVVIQSSINSFGEIVMSGNAAALNIEGFMFVCLNAFHQTTLNFTGQNIGANQYKRAKKVFLLCMSSVFVIGLVVSIGVYLAGPHLLKIYLPDSVEAISYGMVRLKCLCLAYCLLGMMDVSGGGLRGMGVSFAPMVISVLGVCGIRIGWIYTIFQIPEFHTPEYLYMSYAISWGVAFVAQTAAYFITYNKKKKKQIK